LRAKTLRRPVPRRCLDVQIVERWNVRVGSWPVHRLGW
jgi:hypothetical protein